MPDDCLPYCPVNELLFSVCRLIRGGIPGLPGFLPGGITEDPESRASGHFLLPDGCRLIGPLDVTDPEDPSPLCNVYNDQQPSPRHPQCAIYWDIPVAVQLYYDRALAPQEMQAAAAKLALLLTADLRLPGGQRLRAIDRLSAPDVRVRALRDIDCTPVSYNNGLTLIDLTFTALCSAIVPSAPAAAVAA
jgi:hypothetical protein